MSCWLKRISVAGLFGLQAIAPAVGEDGFGVDLLRIQFQDTVRSIDYDFTVGELGPDGTLVIPDEGVKWPHWEEWETDYVLYPEGDGATIGLNVEPPGSYTFGFPLLPPGQLRQRLVLGPDGAVGDASGDWTWEVDLGGIRNVDVEDHWYQLAIGGMRDEGLMPRLAVTIWEDPEGEESFLFFEGSLMESGAEFFPTDSDEAYEFDVSLEALSLRLVADQDGQRLRTYYQLEDGDWTMVSEHLLENDDWLPGLFDQLMYVEASVWRFPFLTIGNANWEIWLSSFGYADVLNDLTPGFQGREYLSGEWGAAVGHELAGSGTVPPTWLEPNFLFPDWKTNSDFEEVEAIEYLDEESETSARSVIANDHLEITQTFQMLDTVIGKKIGLAPASEEGEGESLRSNRHVLKQTYEIRNISGEKITKLALFQLLHGLQSHTSLYDDRAYGGVLNEFHHGITQIGIDHGSFGLDFDEIDLEDTDDWDWESEVETVEFEDYIAFWSEVAPVSVENGHFGVENEDSHTTGKPSTGVHVSVEENALDGTDFFAPENGWVAGAQQWELGELEPGESVTFDLLLSIRTGTRVSEEAASGVANGGATATGGVDFSLPGLSTGGTFFANYIAADVEETNKWIEEGEFAELDFPATGERLQAWDLSFGGDFSGAAVITLGYDEGLLTDPKDEPALVMFHWNGAEWEKLESVADPSRNTVITATDGFSWFALGAGGSDTRYLADSFDGDTLNRVRWTPSEDQTLRLVQQQGRLSLVSETGEPGEAVAASTSRFGLGEGFRAKVDIEGSGLDGKEGTLGLAVINAATGDSGETLNDFFLMGLSTAEREGVPSGSKWIAANNIEGEPVVEEVFPASEAEGTLYVEHDSGTFYFSHTGFGAENAMVSFTTDGWTDPENIFLGLVGRSHGNHAFDGLDTYFDNFELTSAVRGGFTAWAADISDAGVRSPEESAAGDGVANLVRYALGAGPYEDARDRLPGVSLDANGRMQMAFQRSANANDLTYDVEASEDLLEWTVVARSQAGGAFESLAGPELSIIEHETVGDLSEVVITDGASLSSSRRSFLRMRVMLEDGS